MTQKTTQSEHREKMINELINHILDTFDEQEKNQYLANLLKNGFQGYQKFSDEDLMQELTDRDISYVFGENDDEHKVDEEEGTAGRAIGLAAEKAVRDRKGGESAFDILDRICRPYEGEMVHTADFWMPQHDRERRGYNSYSDPHPNAALGMLMLEAFAKNGVRSITRYKLMMEYISLSNDQSIEGRQRSDELIEDAEDNEALWKQEIFQPFFERYKFEEWQSETPQQRPSMT